MAATHRCIFGGLQSSCSKSHLQEQKIREVVVLASFTNVDGMLELIMPSTVNVASTNVPQEECTSAIMQCMQGNIRVQDFSIRTYTPCSRNLSCSHCFSVMTLAVESPFKRLINLLPSISLRNWCSLCIDWAAPISSLQVSTAVKPRCF